jgi:very-short-patch-repair endonuclease
MFYNAPAFTFKNAKRLRSNLTRSENILSKRLSKNQLNNLRFKRQYPIGGFIVDFCCREAKLVIEIDRPYHMNHDQIHYDKKRTHELSLPGIKVIRFKNDQVMYNTEEVLDEIKKYLPATPEFPKGDLKV